ncbi:MAG TPA: thioredoxin domain-containing protein [Thermoleophilaceae bacterium]
MTQRAPTRKERRDQARAERVAREQEAARRAQFRRRLGILGGVVGLAIVAVVVAIALSSSGGSHKSSTTGQTTSLFAGIPEKGITLGKPNAPVTLEEYGDLQCPFCREYTLNALPTLVRDYVRTGKVKMVFHNLSFIGPDSVTAGRVAQAAGMQNKLWPFIDRFYANQGQENTGYVTRDFLDKVASQVPGLDKQKLFSDADSAASQTGLAAANASANTRGVKSTPRFFVSVNGKPAQELQPSSLTPGGFESQLNALLAKAT